ncbi:restriction endonuclease subunit S [Vibrio parahaemolyticus]|nr:restriction endonuclease subunit S [Vibrio parahaemolyticus]
MNRLAHKAGWRELRLSDVIKVKSGDSLSKSKMEDGDFPVFGGNGISGYHSTYNTDETKIVIGRVGEYCGAVHKTPQYSWITDNALYVHEKKVDITDEYLFYLLDYLALNQYANRNAQPLVSGKTLEQIACTLPSCLIEQQKIAKVLSTVDKKIDLIDQKIAETEKLKTGLMQKLFSVGVGVQDENGNWQPHTKFKDSKLGKIPDSWNLGTVKDISPLQGGYAFKSKSATESGVRWLKIANVGKRRVTWDNDSYLPEKFIEEHSDFLLNEGDIVIALTRPVLSGELKVARLSGKDAPALLNQRVARINVNCSVADAGFVYYLFEDKRMANSISKVILGTDPPNISTKQIESFDIAIPPLEEQKSIRKVLSSVSSKIDLLVQQKTETQHLKKGLMQKLLTGKWRVPVEETEAA